MLSESVLVLNKSWLAIHITNLKRALSLLYQGLAKVVAENYETYDFDSWRELSKFADDYQNIINTPSFKLIVPKVIVLTLFNKVPPQFVKFSRKNIYIRDNYTCQYCGAKSPKDELTIDHIVPRCKGGTSIWENVVLACINCNAKKGGKLLEDVKMGVIKPPKRPNWLALINDNKPFVADESWQRFIDLAYWNVKLSE